MLGPYPHPRAEAASALVPGWRLRQLARSTVLKARIAVASNPRCPTDVLDMLAGGPSFVVCAAVASNPNCSVDRLRLLAQHPNALVGKAVASAARVSPKTLAWLGQTSSEEVRVAVARNPTASAELLGWMADTDLAPAVRIAVASHPHTSEARLVAFSRSPYSKERAAVAGNSQLPAYALEECSSDKDLAVRVAVAANLRTPARALEVLSQDPEPNVLVKVAGNPGASSADLERVCHNAQSDSDWWVRWAVASHPNASAEILESLSGDIAWMVREVVAQNPRTPARVLERLGRDDHWGVLLAVAAHADASEDVLAELERTGGQEWEMRAALAGNPACPARMLQRFATDRSGSVCLAVAGNRACPQDALTALAQHKNPFVRQRAVDNPATEEEVRGRVAATLDDGQGIPRDSLGAAEGDTSPVVAGQVSPWEEIVAPYGLAAEEVAWSLVQGGFDGSLQDLVAVAVGAVAE